MSKYKLQVEAVIFDMDGVITNTMPDHYKAWHKVLHDAGVKVNHLDIYSREGQPGKQSVKELFAKYGKPYDPKNAKKYLDQKEEFFKKIARKRFIVGARTLIKDLFRCGFQLSIVTGTARHELHRILPDYLYDLFSVVVTGDDVTHGKPHPEPYATALKKLNIKAKNSVVIENAPYGIASAKAAGIKCLALETSLSREHLKQADGIYHSVKDLRSKVSFQKVGV